MRILHIFRTPVGGLFRHIRDLIEGQVALGHEIGVFCGFPAFKTPQEASLERLRSLCCLGIHQAHIVQLPHPSDFYALKKALTICSELKPDIIHAHGSKGGFYGRLVGNWSKTKTFYAPHGGSLHYPWKSVTGTLYLGTEMMLQHLTDGFVFTSLFEKNVFTKKIGLSKPSIIAYNGLKTEDFILPPPFSPQKDVVFIGELRLMKGVDLLLDALSLLQKERTISAYIVGDGPDRARFEKQCSTLGLEESVSFEGALPASQALSMGKIFVAPSRSESFPYVILEALAAQKPTIAARVGGIPEVLDESCLFEANDVEALAHHLKQALVNLPQGKPCCNIPFSDFKEKFSTEKMAKTITDFYALT